VLVGEEAREYLAQTLQLLAAEDAAALHHVLQVDEAVSSVGPLGTGQARDRFVHVLMNDSCCENGV